MGAEVRIDLRNALSTQGSTQSEKSEARVPHVYYIIDNFAGKNLNKPPQVVQPTLFFQSKIQVYGALMCQWQSEYLGL